MSLPRRSQSALEYMMTYGWAILVIVIVAAVLYSLGIFSPSSSLSTTITGFSNLGTVNAVCLGGTSFTISMGDSTGYPINITQINLTSSSGKTTYSPNILIQPNSIQTVTVPSSSLCTSGARYSVSAVISYLEPGQLLPGPYTSTGTVAGTAASPPSSATSYEPLNIINTQNQGTPSPFQQMINVTSSSLGWADISSSPFGQNVEFFSATGQILDSWLENYTSTHAIWWVKLTSSIPAGSKQTIYMGFAPTSTNLFNTNNVGEAPQLSSSYGEYDDGANAFNFYDNFAGTTPNTNNWVVLSGGSNTITVNNGLNIQAAAGTAGYYLIYSKGTFNPGSVLETDFSYGGPFSTNIGSLNPGFSSSQSSSIVPSAQSQNTVAWTINSAAVGDWVAVQGNNNGVNGAAPTYVDSTGNNSDQPLSIWGVTYTGGTNYWTWHNYQQFTSSSSGAQSSGGMYVGLGYESYEYPNGVLTTAINFTFQWVRVRAYPPNGVMPSVSFGSVS